MLQGGGTTKHKGVKVYVLFAIPNLASEDTHRLATEFRSIHINTNASIGGEIIDLSDDHRLEDQLSKTESGRALFKRIIDTAPAICFSNSNIGDIDNVDSVDILGISDYAPDDGAMFEIINSRVTTEEQRKGLLELLEFLNDVLVLQPSIAGLGINFNKALAQLIKRLKR